MSSMACVVFEVLPMCTPLLNSSCESQKWKKINLFFKKNFNNKKNPRTKAL